jgi:hypothetical protein
VLRRVVGDDEAFVISEVHYDDDDKVRGISDPTYPQGATVGDLGGDLKMMLEALDQPVLENREWDS